MSIVHDMELHIREMTFGLPILFQDELEWTEEPNLKEKNLIVFV